jgi:ornithine--oxo-acid transaminase
MISARKYKVEPDMVTIGKSLSGGFMPISMVLGKEKVMGLIELWEHSGTWPANNMACGIAKAAL